MTPFGKQARLFRKERSVLLGDLAGKVGCSASFLSQIEAGNKPIPDGLVGKVSGALGLTARESASLERAAALSAKEFRIALPANARNHDRQIAQQLSVGFARMSTAKKLAILRIMREEDPSDA